MNTIHWLIPRPTKFIMKSPIIVFALSPFFICELLCWRERFVVTCSNSVCYAAISLHRRLFPYSKMVLVRAEPTSWADLEALEGFQSFRAKLATHEWDYFLHLLQGHNEAITLKFALGFDGKQAHMGSLTFEVTEQSIARVTRLPRTGKACSKNSKVSKHDFKIFLKNEYETVSCTKGYPELWIKPEFHKTLAIIQSVIACAGRYSYYQAYHLRILAHFENN